MMESFNNKNYSRRRGKSLLLRASYLIVLVAFAVTLGAGTAFGALVPGRGAIVPLGETVTITFHIGTESFEITQPAGLPFGDTEVFAAHAAGLVDVNNAFNNQLHWGTWYFSRDASWAGGSGDLIGGVTTERWSINREQYIPLESFNNGIVDEDIEVWAFGVIAGYRNISIENDLSLCLCYTLDDGPSQPDPICLEGNTKHFGASFGDTRWERQSEQPIFVRWGKTPAEFLEFIRDYAEKDGHTLAATTFWSSAIPGGLASFVWESPEASDRNSFDFAVAGNLRDIGLVNGVPTFLNPNDIPEEWHNHFYQSAMLMLSVRTMTSPVVFLWNANDYTLTLTCYDEQTVDIYQFGDYPTDPGARSMPGDNYTFLGWFNEPEAITPFNFDEYITGHTRAYAAYAAQEVVVTFVDGSVETTVAVPVGQTVSSQEPQGLQWHTFVGWHTNNESDEISLFDFTTPITNPLRLYAQYVQDVVTVTWVDASSTTTESVNAGTVLTERTPQGQDRYTFIGWFVDALGNTPHNFAAPVSGNLRIYAVYSPPAYVPTIHVVTFIDQSIETTVGVVNNASVSQPQEAGTDHHTFLGWYTAPQGGQRWNFDTGITSNVRLYARYLQITHNVTFVVGEDESSVVVNAGSNAQEPTAPEREGYNFAGWYTAPQGGVRFDFNTVITEDLRLYAAFVLPTIEPPLVDGEPDDEAGLLEEESEREHIQGDGSDDSDTSSQLRPSLVTTPSAEHMPGVGPKTGDSAMNTQVAAMIALGALIVAALAGTGLIRTRKTKTADLE